MKLWQAFTDEKLLGAAFEPPGSWAAHVALLKVLEGDTQALTNTEWELVAACTNRDTFEPAREALILAGRRSGKSRGICCSGSGGTRGAPHVAASGTR